MNQATNQTLEELRSRKLAQAKAEVEIKKQIQGVKTWYEYPVIVSQSIAAANALQSYQLQLDSSGAFDIMYLQASFLLTGFPASGILTIKITDQLANKSITEGFNPLHHMASPGFLGSTPPNQIAIMRPFPYLAAPNCKLIFDVQNSHAANAATLWLSVCGYRYI
jgi:hypothetical protein